MLSSPSINSDSSVKKYSCSSLTSSFWRKSKLGDSVSVGVAIVGTEIPMLGAGHLSAIALVYAVV